jgi:hypothetical protein
MKVSALVFFASLSFLASGWAGEIYGTIKESGRPVKNLQVEIKSANNMGYKGKTDEFGNYRIIVADPGKCTIAFTYNDKPVSADVQSYPTPVRFDWALEKTGDTYSLKRQ